ncbi:putative PDZ domain, Zinc finger, RanBP2-type, ubiquitin specific protease domain, PDZ superfamily [Plasmopara halstedii]
MLGASTSSESLSARKGLSNEIGANNCFLNVIIQSLWHVRSCRALISMGDHAVHHRCGGQHTNAGSVRTQTITPCLLCELEQIFIMYQFAEQPVLDVERVRLALGDKFALGAMNDATETLEAILDALHYDTFNQMLLQRRKNSSAIGMTNIADEMSASLQIDASAIICEPQCVAHRLFQMNLMELKICASCGHTAEPIMNTDFLYRVYAQEVLNNARSEKNGTKMTLEDALRTEAQSQKVAGTCELCDVGGHRALSRWILTLPMVFAISIIWSSTQMNKTDIKDWLELLSTQCQIDEESQQALDLGRIFRLDNSTEDSSCFSFRGLVCYYGRHYVGFFASTSLDDNGVERQRWFLFDDTRVKLVGTWADARQRIERGGYQPTLLFYEQKGIKHETLEKIATEIHKWWEAAADKPTNKKDASEKLCTGTTIKSVPHEVERGIEDKLLAKMERSVQISQKDSLSPFVQAQSRTLPISPVLLPTRAPKSVPAQIEFQAGNGWRDEDFHLHKAHQSAQDTLQRLNGILAKDKGPLSTPVDRRAVLRMAMSHSMQNSVRLRDYSVHPATDEQLDVNPDNIFDDENPVTKGNYNMKSFQSDHALASIEFDDMPAQTPHGPLMGYDVSLNASDGGIGLLLDDSPIDESSASAFVRGIKKVFTVSGFEVNGLGAKLSAEASGAIRKGDILVGINDHMLENEDLVHVLEMLLMSPNPVHLKFIRFQLWSCPRCTLLNKVTDVVCAACGHKPAVESLALLR